MSRADPAATTRAISPVAVAFGGIALLCAMDAVIKHLGRSEAVVMVTFGRYVAGTAFAYPLYRLVGKTRLTRAMLPLHAVRGVVIAVAAFTFFWALTVLPLAETLVLSFIAPLLIPLIARLLLGERLRKSSIAAGLVGFGGVIVTIQGAPPGLDTPERNLGILSVLCSAVAYALSIVLLRARAGQDGPYIVGLLAAAIPALVVAPFAIVTASPPAASTIPWFLLAGLLGTGGMYLLAKAYAQAEAQQLAPLEYTALGWAALFGYVFFAEVPRVEVFLGAAIIAGACLFAAWDERRSRV